MDSIPIQVLALIILILINGFFAASEIAVISLNPAVLLTKIEEGDKKAQKLYELNKESASFLSTIQVGITFAGFLSSAFAAESFSGHIVNYIYYDLAFTLIPPSVLDTLAVIIITIILSFFTLIFGELVPKQIGMRYAYQVASFTSGFILVIEKIMRPIVFLLSKSTNLILKLLHIDPDYENDEVSEEEIISMASLGEQKGVIDADENEWIQNVFKFDDITIKEIMTHRTEIVAIKEDDDYKTIQEVIKNNGLSRLPIYNKQETDIVGVVYARDIFLADKDNFNLKDIMRKPYFVPENLKADYLFDEMRKKKIHFAIVVDEYGGIDGIVTMEDLVEAIVGEIYDEYDKNEKEEYHTINDHRWLVSGSMNIDDVYDLTKIKDFKTEEEYETISGFILSRLNAVPNDGEVINLETENCLIEVTKIIKHKMIDIIIEKKLV